MANRNAYFQLENRTDGIYLLLFPGTEEKKLDYKEIDEYLHAKRIDYDKIELMKAINNFSAFCSVRLCSQPGMTEKEFLQVAIDPDRKAAFGRFYPPSKGGALLTREEIIAEMVRAGIKFGANEESIDGFLKDRQYCRTYLLAKAMLPVEGSSASITYHFNTDFSKKPKMNEDGSVDFHQLDIISHVKAGDCLATLKPAVPGKPGIDVTGRVIAPLQVKYKALKPGKNMQISEDGCQLISLVNGHVSLIGDMVFVSNTYEIPADVDTSTGDIDYDGNVVVRGNVLTGFSIHARGDIVVDGVVEGAELVAGGQIILKRGIQGMSRGRLTAGSNVITKFIENAEVNAGGYVTTEAILHSRVSARGEITASGKRGFVTGGEIHSGTGITVKTAGSTMGTTTLLEVGNDPALMEEYHRIDNELPQMEAEMDKMSQLLNLFTKKIQAGENLDAEKQQMMLNVRASRDEMEMKIKKALARMEELQEISGAESNGCIKISGTMYAGCKVILYNIVYYARNDLKYCKLIKDRAEVKVTSY